jgi:hypothetical protein
VKAFSPAHGLRLSASVTRVMWTNAERVRSHIAASRDAGRGRCAIRARRRRGPRGLRMRTTLHATWG